jgi:hypothetical protein
MCHALPLAFRLRFPQGTAELCVLFPQTGSAMKLHPVVLILQVALRAVGWGYAFSA